MCKSQGHLQKILVYDILWFQCKPLISIAISMMWMAPPHCMAMSRAQEFWHTPVPETHKTSATFLLIYPQMTNNSTLHSQHFSLFGAVFLSWHLILIYWGKHFLAPPTPPGYGPRPQWLWRSHITTPPRLLLDWPLPSSSLWASIRCNKEKPVEFIYVWWICICIYI